MGAGAAIAVGSAAMGIGKGFMDAQSARAAGRANAEAAALGAAAQASQLRAQGAQMSANARMEAVNYEAMADYYLRAAGNFQLQGREERALRGIAAGQQLGRMKSQAAGSGLDVSSRVVQKTYADTVKSLYHDYETSAWNEYQNAYGAMKNWKTSRVNAANKRAIANWAESAYDALAGQVTAAGQATASGMLDAANRQAAGSVIGGFMSGAMSLGTAWAGGAFSSAGASSSGAAGVGGWGPEARRMALFESME